MSTDENIFFHGHDGHNLDRLVALANFRFLVGEDYDLPDTGDATVRCGYLVTRFRGAALEWAVLVSARTPQVMSNFNGFVAACKLHFGVNDETQQIMRRGELEALRWGSDVAIFFAEFDRLTFALRMTSDEALISLVSSKLPTHVTKLLAEQALVFNHYPTMRQRIVTMWALGAFGKPTDAATCSVCGKRGHTASNCRSAKN